MRKTKKAKPEHIRHVRRVLEVLVESFGDRLLQDISRKELENLAKISKICSNHGKELEVQYNCRLELV